MPPLSTSAPGHLRYWRVEEYIVGLHYLPIVFAILRRLQLPEYQSIYAYRFEEYIVLVLFRPKLSHLGASIYWSTCVLQ